MPPKPACSAAIAPARTSAHRAPKGSKSRSMCTVALLRVVADRLDVVAVGITDEAAVVVRVVLGPHPRLVQHLGASRDRRVEEGVHRGAVGGQGRDVRLAEAVAGLR